MGYSVLRRLEMLACLLACAVALGSTTHAQAQDADGDGVPDAIDACPTEFGRCSTDGGLGGCPCPRTAETPIVCNGGTAVLTIDVAAARLFPATGPVTIVARAQADFGGPSEFVRVTVEGIMVPDISGADCTIQSRAVTVPASTFNAWLADGQIPVSALSGAGTDCTCASQYFFIEFEGAPAVCTTDSDGDGQPNCVDADDDNDGVPDPEDAFPLDPSESADSDGDGVGNNADLDDDNDGIADATDNCPRHPNANQADCDSDGAGDTCELANGTALDENSNGRPDNCDIAWRPGPDLPGIVEWKRAGSSGQWYWISTESLDWIAARQAAHDLKGELLCLSSSAEWRYIRSRLSWNWPWPHIGLTGSCSTTGLTWTSGEPVRFLPPVSYSCNEGQTVYGYMGGDGALFAVNYPWEWRRFVVEFDFRDCNQNGRLDAYEIRDGALDCDENGLIDACEAQDCDRNGVLDRCENDANHNGRLDSCDLAWSPAGEAAAAVEWMVGQYGNHWYLASTDRRTYWDAVDHAESLGGHLAVISNGVERGFITSILNANPTRPYFVGHFRRCPWDNCVETVTGEPPLGDEAYGDQVLTFSAASAWGVSNALEQRYYLIEFDFADSNADGILDSTQDPALLDCDGNRTRDAVDLALFPSLDCDLSGRIDGCEIEGYQFAANASGGFAQSAGSTSFTVPVDPDVQTELRLTLAVSNGDFAEAPKGEWAEIELEDGTVLRTTGSSGSCTNASAFRTIAFNQALLACSDGALTGTIRIGPGVDDLGCGAINYTVSVSYWTNALASDCDGNGQLDSCQITAATDCDGNGLLDTCEVASGATSDINRNGRPDSCDIAWTPSGATANATQWVRGTSDRHWYLIDESGRTYEGARSYARSLGGHLLTIGSAAENEFVSRFVLDRGFTTGAFWIGFQSTNCSLLDYGWYTGEPVRFRPKWTQPTATCDGREQCLWHPTTGLIQQYAWYGYYSIIEFDFSDCDQNGALDIGQIIDLDSDCGGDGILDACQTIVPVDCDGNGVADSCQTASGESDCNRNGVPDSCDLQSGLLTDTNADGVPDACAADCNADGISNRDAIAAGIAQDCNANGVPDACDITSGLEFDENGNGRLDSCDAAWRPTEPQPGLVEWVRDGIGSHWYLPVGTTRSFENSRDYALGLGGRLVTVNTPDEWEFLRQLQGPASTTEFWLGMILPPNTGSTCTQSTLVNATGEPRRFTPPVYSGCGSYGIAKPSAGCAVGGNSVPRRSVIEFDFTDCNGNRRLDMYELFDAAADCNQNGLLDVCELDRSNSDIDRDGVLDECEPDCNSNGLPDDFDIAQGSPDCNANEVPDTCDIALGVRDDNQDGVPDACTDDCDGDGVTDIQELIAGTAIDLNGNQRPDACDTTWTPSGELAGAVEWTAGDYGSHWYWLSPTTLTFEQARARAIAMGGHLAVINSQAEWNFVLGLVSSFPARGYFVGTSRPCSCCTWTTVTGEPRLWSEPFSFTNCDSAVYVGSTQFWRSTSPLNQYYYIVEFDYSDVDGDGVLDTHDPDAAVDCNSNGLRDFIEASISPGLDCDDSLRLDSCETAITTVSRTSSYFDAPIAGTSGNYSFGSAPDAPLPPPGSNVSVAIQVVGSVADPVQSEYLDIELENGQTARLWGVACSGTVSFPLEIPRSAAQRALADGILSFHLTTGAGAIELGSCRPRVRLVLNYTAATSSVDLDLNRRPDTCDLNGGSLGVTGAVEWIRDGIGKHWYWVSSQPSTLSAAHAQAQSLGGRLLSVTTEAEWQFVCTGLGLSPSADYWLGVNAGGWNCSSRYVVNMSGEEFRFDPPWRGGNCSLGFTRVLRTGFGWLTANPNSSYRYIVEFDFTDCDGNGIFDWIDMFDTALDCDADGRLDSCQPPAQFSDCNGDGLRDACQARDPAIDCDGDGFPDSCELATGAASDVDGDGIPDSCERDCDDDGILDPFAIATGLASDCDGDGTPDECQLAEGIAFDLNQNGRLDACDAAWSPTGDAAPAQQWVRSGIGNHWYLVSADAMSYADAKQRAQELGGHLVTLNSAAEASFVLSLIPGNTDFWTGFERPCGACATEYYTWYTGELAIASGVWASNSCGGCDYTTARFRKSGSALQYASYYRWNELRYIIEFDFTDCDGDGALDRFEVLDPALDCNADGLLDSCQVTSTTDCDGDGVFDSCEIAANPASDCNNDSVLDACQLTSQFDCDANGLIDSCEIASNPANDCNNDSIKDSCQFGGLADCNGNGVLDLCEIASGAAVDLNANGRPDPCDLTWQPSGSTAAAVQWSTGSYGHHWYLLSTVKKTWTEARAAAQALGGHLAVITSSTEWQFVRGLISSQPNNSFYVGHFRQSSCSSFQTVTGENWSWGAPWGYLGCETAAAASYVANWRTSNPTELRYFIIEFDFADVDGDGQLDAREPFVDCNGNLLRDSAESVLYPELDCDGSFTLDSCDTTPTPAYNTATGTLPAPSGTATIAIQVNPNLGSTVSIYLEARADLDEAYKDEWVDFEIEGLSTVRVGGGICSGSSTTTVLSLATALPLFADGILNLLVHTGPSVDPAVCVHSYEVRVSYGLTPTTPDCNLNGLPDSCDIESGLARDCDENGVPDSCDIAGGAADANGDGIPDACQNGSADINGDGIVSAADLTLLLTFWGQSPPSNGDIDGDGSVGAQDLSILLARWGGPGT